MRELVVADTYLGHLAKAGIDTVDGIAVRDDVVYQLVGFGDTSFRILAEGYGHIVVPRLAEFGQRDHLVFDEQFHAFLPASTMGRLRPFSFAHWIAIS